MLAGRPAPDPVGLAAHNIRLIDGAPYTRQIAKRRNDLARVTLKPDHHFRVLPAAFLCHPDRVGEVVECDHRLNPTLAQPFHHLPIASDGALIPDARLRFNTAPFYR